jgi:hypothetical protein
LILEALLDFELTKKGLVRRGPELWQPPIVDAEYSGETGLNLGQLAGLHGAFNSARLRTAGINPTPNRYSL